jgi:hypothetical protein
MGAEIVNGPEGHIVVPAELEILHPHGFMVRGSEDDTVVVELLGQSDDLGQRPVISRLAFSPEGLGHFIRGLVTICSRP